MKKLLTILFFMGCCTEKKIQIKPKVWQSMEEYRLHLIDDFVKRELDSSRIILLEDK